MHFLQYRCVRFFSVIVFLLAALLRAPNGFAQTPKVLAPHVPIPPRITDSRDQQFPPTLRSMVGGFWRINPSSRASIYIRNGLDNSPLTVTPIVYLSNGARYSLSPVTLRPLGTAVVSINKSLEAQGIAPYAELSGPCKRFRLAQQVGFTSFTAARPRTPLSAVASRTTRRASPPTCRSTPSLLPKLTPRKCLKNPTWSLVS